MDKVSPKFKPKTVLVVDDELDVVRLVAYHLAQAGFSVYEAYDGKSGIDICLSNPIDLLILDIMLPQLSGWEVCQLLKAHPKTYRLPIIILSALAEEEARIKGFRLGADDYMVKPFSPRELVCRVKNILHQMEVEKKARSVIRVGEITIDFSRHRVFRQDKEIFLSIREFNLLKLLATHQGCILKRDEIIDALWDQDRFIEYGNIDVHICHLRKKLEPDPHKPRHIVTKKGVGYLLAS